MDLSLHACQRSPIAISNRVENRNWLVLVSLTRRRTNRKIITVSNRPVFWCPMSQGAPVSPTLTFFIKMLVSSYTDHHRKPQLLLCCPSLTLNHAVHVKLGLVKTVFVSGVRYWETVHLCTNSCILTHCMLNIKIFVRVIKLFTFLFQFIVLPIGQH